MATSPFYSPSEPESTIVEEKVWFQGTLLSNLFFGIETTLCILAFLAVLKKREPDYRRTRLTLLIYIAVLYALTTAAQGLMIEWIQMGFITQRNHRGGPSGFLDNGWSTPVNLGANVLIVFANWMMESLFVWRCYVICSTGGRVWQSASTIPLLSLVAVFATGCNFIYQTLHTIPSTTAFLAYGCSSLALNVTATAFIAGRLLIYRHQVVSRLGQEHGKQYVGIVAVVVESAVMYTCFLLVVIIAYATQSTAMNLLQQVIVQVQTITSLLIIYRIASGEGWTKSADKGAVHSSLLPRFAPPPPPPPSHNVIQLEVISIQEDVEDYVQRKEDSRGISLTRDEE